MPDDPNWAEAKRRYNAQDRSWIPVSREFFHQMRDVLPPAHDGRHPALGCHFAVSEEWKHLPDGQAVYLFLRSKPEPACRAAPVLEIRAERESLLPPDWKKVSAVEQIRAIAAVIPKGDIWNGMTHYALGEFFGNQNLTHILGKGWYRNPKAKPQFAKVTVSSQQPTGWMRLVAS